MPISTLWQNIVSGTHNCEWQCRASYVCYCGAIEQHSSRHAHAFRWIKCCVGPEGKVCPRQALVPKFRPGVRRFCNLMVYNNNRKQTLADWGLSSSEKAVAARLGACTGRRAYSGRHPAKPGSLVVDPFAQSTTPSSGADILKAKGRGMVLALLSVTA